MLIVSSILEQYLDCYERFAQLDNAKFLQVLFLNAVKDYSFIRQAKDRILDKSNKNRVQYTYVVILSNPTFQKNFRNTLNVINPYTFKVRMKLKIRSIICTILRVSKSNLSFYFSSFKLSVIFCSFNRMHYKDLNVYFIFGRQQLQYYLRCATSLAMIKLSWRKNFI